MKSVSNRCQSGKNSCRHPRHWKKGHAFFISINICMSKSAWLSICVKEMWSYYVQHGWTHPAWAQVMWTCCLCGYKRMLSLRVNPSKHLAYQRCSHLSCSLAVSSTKIQTHYTSWIKKMNGNIWSYRQIWIWQC